nr:uncharacterized protein CI109_006159 [Kwoniella shandongensis]KAA5525468.1 hypothetical protein CI109_006159 [Kwoniella shandongensis]
MQASTSRPNAQRTRSAGSASGSDTGFDSESDYSSSDVTEDEDGQELTPALDAAILRTLSKIKSKDPKVYGSENILQEELKRAQEKAQEKGLKAGIVKKAAAKPYLLSDYHRSKLLSGNNADDEEEDQPEPLPYVQSQYILRQEAVSAFKSLVPEDDEEEDDEFGPVKRDKDDEEVDQDEEEYRQFLLEMGGGEEEVRKILGMGDAPVAKHLEVDSEDEEEQEEEKVLSKVEKEELAARKLEKKAKKAKADDDFLMNYILNRGWIDRTDDHVPTYDEVVGVEKEEVAEVAVAKPKASSSSHPWGALEAEDDFDEKAEQFETEYNFRFEEPGASTIAAHPRDIPSLVRRPDDARKSKRARRAERKAAEKAALEEDLKKKKGSKRREMEKRMTSLKQDLAAEGVEGEVDWDQLEKVLDGEWDEGEWEKVVGGMLSKVDEAEDEDGKPIWNDDLGDAEYDEFDDEENDGGNDMEVDQTYNEDDEGPINMDADFIDAEPSKKKQRKRNKHRAPTPDVQLPSEEADLTVADKAKKVKEAMEEYRALDHEDMIGDLPTKFKYTKAPPTSFGLSPVEILLATDEELNKVVGVKSIAPYKKGGIGMAGMGLGKRVRDLKDELRNRRWGEENKSWEQQGGESSNRERDNGYGDREQEKRSTKRKGRKERQRDAKANGKEGQSSEAGNGTQEQPQAEGKRKAEVVESAVDGAGDADGESKKKRRKKKKAVEA